MPNSDVHRLGSVAFMSVSIAFVAGRTAMHIVSVRDSPAELAIRLTEPRFPAQGSKSAGGDRSFVGSIRISRISVPLRATNIKNIWHVPRLFHFRLDESRKRSGLCVVQLPVGARPFDGQGSEGSYMNAKTRRKIE